MAESANKDNDCKIAQFAFVLCIKICHQSWEIRLFTEKTKRQLAIGEIQCSVCAATCTDYHLPDQKLCGAHHGNAKQTGSVSGGNIGEKMLGFNHSIWVRLVNRATLFEGCCFYGTWEVVLDMVMSQWSRLRSNRDLWWMTMSKTMSNVLSASLSTAWGDSPVARRIWVVELSSATWCGQALFWSVSLFRIWPKCTYCFLWFWCCFGCHQVSKWVKQRVWMRAQLWITHTTVRLKPVSACWIRL